MRRTGRRIALRAIVVESLFGLILLFLLFPSASDPAAGAARNLPTLNISSPFVETTDQPIRDVGSPWEAGRTSGAVRGTAQRRQFVAQELDYSSRALATMLNQHIQELVAPMRADLGP